MDKQEIFDKSVQYFKDNYKLGPCTTMAIYPNCVDSRESEWCAYFDSKTNRTCVIGQFIPHTSPMMKFIGNVSSLYHNFRCEFVNIFGEDVDVYFLQNIQRIHDNMDEFHNLQDRKENIIQRLENIALDYGLNRDSLENF